MIKRKFLFTLIYFLPFGLFLGFITFNNHFINQQLQQNNKNLIYTAGFISAGTKLYPAEFVSGGKWTAPSWADTLKNPLSKIVQATKKGKSIFNSQCYVCHGTDGKGDGLAAGTINPKPANLTSPEVQKQSDGAIYWKITTGKLPMASYKNVYSDKQRWELVNYIRVLGRNKKNN